MSELPTFKLLLTPKTSDGTTITGVQVSTTFTIPPLRTGDVLTSLPLTSGNIPCQQFPDLSVVCNGVAIPLKKSIVEYPGGKDGSNKLQIWTVDYQPDYQSPPLQGTITVRGLAAPRLEEDVLKSTGSRVEVVVEEGGLQGAMCSSIPLRTYHVEGRADDAEYRISMEWDLSELSSAQKWAVCPLGEGPGPFEVEGSLAQWIKCGYFMVGNIFQYPPRGWNVDGKFGFYWLGEDTPKVIAELGPVNHDLHQRMRELFDVEDEGGDGEENTDRYHIFAFRSLEKEQLGGSASWGHFVLEYSMEYVIHRPKEEILSLLGHEMIHGFLAMDHEEDDSANNWYIEGIANYYSPELLRRYGLIDNVTYLKDVNECLLKYYTNPLRDYPEKDLEDRWSSLLKVDLSYNRGFTLFMKTDALIRAKTNNEFSLDDVVLKLRRMRGEARRQDWIDGVAKYLGKATADDLLNDMLEGKLIILPETFGGIFEVVRVDREFYELGFEKENGLVSNLMPNSRAKHAGLHEGDEIVYRKNWRGYGAVSEWTTVGVKRGGEVIDIMYWPWSMEKASCWEVREIQSV